MQQGISDISSLPKDTPILYLFHWKDALRYAQNIVSQRHTIVHYIIAL